MSRPPTSEECTQAWIEGYAEGYGPTVGGIPPRPGGIPSGVTNPLKHFRDEGFRQGQLDRMRKLGNVPPPTPDAA